MAFPDHLLALATLRLLTLAPNERFHSIKASPLRVLTELTSAYLHLLAGAAKGSAEQAGRTSANALDARQAIAQYGLSLDELFEWCEERRLDGGILAQTAELENGEGEVSSLGALLKDTSYDSSHQAPRQVIEYAPLNRREDQIYQTVQSNQSLLPFLPYDIQQQVQAGNTEDDSSDSDIEMQPRNTHSPSPSSSRALSLPPTYQQAIASGSSPALTFKQREKQRAQQCRDEVDSMSFLPPFPDRDATPAALQTVIEDESGRTIKRARRAIEPSSKRSGATAWMRAIPYDVSSLAEFEGPNLTLPSIPPDTVAASFDYEDDLFNGRDAESTTESLSKRDDPLTSSSLFYFLETFNWLSLDYEQHGEQAMLPLRHNLKRKRAATAIHSNILNPSDDSLSGNIPVAQPRHAKKQAGWIPYPPVSKDIQDASEPAGKAVLPFPAMHPFSTQLPPTITEPVPTVMLPHATRVLAPAMHPRYPTAHSSVRTLLEAQSLALFTRTTRLGPPGPLLDNGSAGFYQIEAEKPNIPGWPGDAAPRMLGWNFDWEIGNELEDGIKERKTAGILNAAEAQNAAGPVASTSTGSAESHKFPALPARPQYNQPVHVAQQLEHENELQFQEEQRQQKQEDQEDAQLAQAQATEFAQDQSRNEIALEQEGSTATTVVLEQAHAPPAPAAAQPLSPPKRTISLRLPTAPQAASTTPAEPTPTIIVKQEETPLATPMQYEEFGEFGSGMHVDPPQVAGSPQPTAPAEQDFRALAMDISAISQPAIVVPAAAPANQAGIEQIIPPMPVEPLPFADEPSQPERVMEAQDVAATLNAVIPADETNVPVLDVQAAGKDGNSLNGDAEDSQASGAIGLDFLAPLGQPAPIAEASNTPEVAQVSDQPLQSAGETMHEGAGAGGADAAADVGAEDGEGDSDSMDDMFDEVEVGVQ